MNDEHQISAVETGDNGADVLWRCECGEVNTGYASLHEAALAAAEHQLPPQVVADLTDGMPRGNTVEEWRSAVRCAADEAAEADPWAWQWYRNTVDQT